MADKYIIDLDGTVLSGYEELNRSSLFIKSLEEKGTPYLLATNSIKSHDAQVRRLRGIGLDVSPRKNLFPRGFYKSVRPKERDNPRPGYRER